MRELVRFWLGTVVLWLGAMVAEATSQDYFTFYTYKSKGTATISKYVGSSSVVSVPSVVRADSGDRDSDGDPIFRNYTVTEVGSGTFSGNASLTHVTIPSTVTINRRSCAFSGCSSLKAVVFQGKVVEIPNSMFSGCKNLETLTLDWRNVTSIGSCAFKGCGYAFGALDYMPNLRSVGGSAFAGVGGLTSVSLTSLERIGPEAFAGCGNLESVAVDGPRLVLECSNVDGPFSCCPKLRSVRLGDGVVDLQYRTFRGSDNLESVEVGRGVASFGEPLVEGRKSLRTFVARGAVGTIPYKMFYGCGALTDLRLQWSAVTNVGYSAFAGCSNWEVERLDFLSNIETINSFAFSGCRKIQSVHVPETAMTVGESAFSGCSGLTNLVWQAGEVPNNAFYNCASLSTIVFGQALQKIAGSAFSGCTGVRHVYFDSAPPAFRGSFSPAASCMARGWALAEPDAWDAVVDKTTGMWHGLYMEVGAQNVDLFVAGASIPDGSITLGWTSEFRPPDLTYDVYRTVEGGQKEIIATNLVQNASSITNTFVDSGFRSAEPFTRPIDYELVPKLFDIECEGTIIRTRNRRAVVVGCSIPFTARRGKENEKGEDLGNRPEVVRDVKDISELLSANGGFAVESIVGEAAKKVCIQDALTNAVCESIDGDYVFFYIEAHGGIRGRDQGRFVGNRLLAADQYYFAKDLLSDVRANLKSRPGVAFQGVVMACHSEGIVSDDTLSDDELDVLDEEGLGICLANESWIASCGCLSLSLSTSGRWSFLKKIMFDNGWRCAAADVYAPNGENRPQDFQLTFAELASYTQYLYDAVPQSGGAKVFLKKMVGSVAAIPFGSCEKCRDIRRVGPPRIGLSYQDKGNMLEYSIDDVDGGVQFFVRNIFVISSSDDRRIYAMVTSGIDEPPYSGEFSVPNIWSGARSRTLDELLPKIGVGVVAVGLFNVSEEAYQEYVLTEKDLPPGFLDWLQKFSDWLQKKDLPPGSSDLLQKLKKKDLTPWELFKLYQTLAANGQSLGDNYIAGLDPTDRNARFCIKSFEMKDGKPHITVNPNLGSARKYSILGAERPDGIFGPVKESSRYFKACVAMPDADATNP